MSHLKPGSTFRARNKIGQFLNYDAVFATFTVTEVRRSGIFVADGICDEKTEKGKNFSGLTRRRGVRFKDNAEFQPAINPGWTILKSKGAFSMERQKFSIANMARCAAADGFGHEITDWSPSDWVTATAGELGELAAAMVTHGASTVLKSPTDAIAEELADFFIYLDLTKAALCAAIGFDFISAERDDPRATNAHWSPSPSTGPDRAMLFITANFGLAADVVKKLNRERDNITGNTADHDTLVSTLGRFILNTDAAVEAFAHACGINLMAAVVEKFDRTSEKIGYPVRLAEGAAQ